MKERKKKKERKKITRVWREPAFCDNKFKRHKERSLLDNNKDR
jgi:hypothetical protein